MALPRGRVVKLKDYDYYKRDRPKQEDPPIRFLHPKCKAPDMLFAGRESRDVALKEYRLIQLPAFRHPVYISYEDDILLMSGQWVMKCLFPKKPKPGPWSWSAGCVRRIALDVRGDFQNRISTHYFQVQDIRRDVATLDQYFYLTDVKGMEKFEPYYRQVVESRLRQSRQSAIDEYAATGLPLPRFPDPTLLTYGNRLGVGGKTAKKVLQEWLLTEFRLSDEGIV